MGAVRQRTAGATAADELEQADEQEQFVKEMRRRYGLTRDEAVEYLRNWSIIRGDEPPGSRSA